MSQNSSDAESPLTPEQELRLATFMDTLAIILNLNVGDVFSAEIAADKVERWWLIGDPVLWMRLASAEDLRRFWNLVERLLPRLAWSESGSGAAEPRSDRSEVRSPDWRATLKLGLQPLSFAMLRDARVDRDGAAARRMPSTYWACLLGEAMGRLCADAWAMHGADHSHAAMADRLAEVIERIDLFAEARGIDLAEAIARRFNAVSEHAGRPQRLFDKVPFPAEPYAAPEPPADGAAP